MLIKWLANRIMFARARRLSSWLAQHTSKADKINDLGSGTGHNAIALRDQHDIEIRQFDIADMHWVGTAPESVSAFPKKPEKDNYTTTLLAHVLHYCQQPTDILRLAANSSNELVILQSTCVGPVSNRLLRIREFFYGRLPFFLARTARLITTPTCPLHPAHCFTRESLLAQFSQAGLVVKSWQTKGWFGVHTNLIALSPKTVEVTTIAPRVERSEGQKISIIIPARNEENWIAGTLSAAQRACNQLHAQHERDCEILVVDNRSEDRTAEVVRDHAKQDPRIRLIKLKELGAARARNAGREQASGSILVFVDADTQMPSETLCNIAEHCNSRSLLAGITAIGCLERSFRARIWWTFWNQVRRLPLPRAKAMPALMFCTADAFDHFGPFDEDVAIGEEWPILADLYRYRRNAVVYDRTLVACSSSRRMDRMPFGYSRTLLKYIWAILHRSGRIHYTDTIR